MDNQQHRWIPRCGPPLAWTRCINRLVRRFVHASFAYLRRRSAALPAPRPGLRPGGRGRARRRRRGGSPTARPTARPAARTPTSRSRPTTVAAHRRCAVATTSTGSTRRPPPATTARARRPATRRSSTGRSPACPRRSRRSSSPPPTSAPCPRAWSGSCAAGSRRPTPRRRAPARSVRRHRGVGRRGDGVREGVFAKVLDNGIRCIAAAVPEHDREGAQLVAHRATIAALDLEVGGFSDAALSALINDQFAPSGIIVAGHRYAFTIDGRDGKGRTATDAYRNLANAVQGADGCFVGGCSGQICSDQEGVDHDLRVARGVRLLPAGDVRAPGGRRVRLDPGRRAGGLPRPAPAAELTSPRSSASIHRCAAPGSLVFTGRARAFRPTLTRRLNPARARAYGPRPMRNLGHQRVRRSRSSPVARAAGSVVTAMAPSMAAAAMATRVTRAVGMVASA